MSVIPGECPLMFLPGGAWMHRFHGLVKKSRIHIRADHTGRSFRGLSAL